MAIDPCPTRPPARTARVLGIAACAALVLLWSANGTAARGDKLYIAHDDAPVRERPSEDAPRLLMLDRGHLVVEAAASGAWIRVGIARMGTVMGWVNRRDLTTVRPAARSRPPRPAFGYFMTVLERFNRAVEDETGEPLFSEVHPVTDEVIQLTASALWRRLPRRSMRRNLSLIADRWADVNGSGNPVWVQVLAPDGSVLMSERRGT